jgi:high-affinity iron transporter
MLPSFLLSLREGLEAAMVLGIISVALRKLNRPELGRAVWSGVATAIGVSLAAAILLNILGAEIEGMGESVFEAITMLSAAILLTGMIFWMQRQSRVMKSNLEAKIRLAAGQQGRWALFLVAFLAVVREGIELALYLLAARFATNPLETIAGTAMGLAGAALLGWIIFTSTYRLSLMWFFRVTNVLLLFFAAGLVGLGVHALNEVGLIPSLVEPLWNINNILPESSVIGQALRSLFGYSAAPSLTSAVAYTAYLAALALILFWPRQRSVRS